MAAPLTPNAAAIRRPASGSPVRVPRGAGQGLLEIDGAGAKAEQCGKIVAQRCRRLKCRTDGHLHRSVVDQSVKDQAVYPEFVGLFECTGRTGLESRPDRTDDAVLVPGGFEVRSENRDRRFTIAVPELLEKLAGIVDDPGVWTTDEFPLVLSAGKRRAFTANTIIRDPAWRRRDAEGALRISPADAESHGVTNGDSARLVTERGAADVLVEVSDMMQEGHISLPNGLGTHHRDADGTQVQTGVAPNDLTSVDRRDWLAGTPWHKNVPARIEPVPSEAHLRRQ